MRASSALRSIAAGTAGTATMTLAYMVEHRIRRQEHELGLLLRWSYGSVFGVWHGTLRRIVREPWASVGFGATLMTATLTLVPLLGAVDDALGRSRP